MIEQMLPEVARLVGVINININPVLIDTGGFELTWHGLFTALGIALGVWLSVRLARRTRISEDDAMSIAVVSVLSGIVGARLLWVLEHTDQIGSIGDVFALTDGGISIYGAMIGGVLGGFIYVTLFKPDFPKWIALDVAAPGMILGQAVGRLGDFVNGEHFANASDLPWAFRYTHPLTDGPWSSPDFDEWYRGSRGLEGEAPVAVHPVAGGYEPILDFMILGGLFLLRRMGVGAGWGFTFYVFAYAVVRGSLSLLRTDEAAIAGALSVPQLLAIVTAAAAVWMALHLRRHRQPPVQGAKADRPTHRASRRGGLGRG